MGNKLVSRRQVVDEKYTRPQGLYHHKDVDIKKLRKLILESKLAPCYPGDEDGACELEECPICFLYYPSLNRSRCCTKGICTECFLQMKVPNSNGPTQCPFCKTLNYAVEYRGAKTKEEKGIEQVEEQRVIEAKIRIRQKELQDEEERMQKRQNLSSSSRNLASGETENSAGAPSTRSHLEGEDIVSDGSCASSVRSHPPLPRSNREDEFDLDLEDVMVMEAIWLSIQENGKQKALGYGGEVVGPSSSEEDDYVCEQKTTPSVCCSAAASPSGGLACAIAALAERQQVTTGETSSSSNCCNSNSNSNSCSEFYSSSSRRREGESNHYHHASNVRGPSHNCGMVNEEEEWSMVEEGRSYHQSVGVGGSPEQEEVEEEADAESSRHLHHQNVVLERGGGGVVAESFEEQMMVAMAVSLAEARVPPGVTWH